MYKSIIFGALGFGLGSWVTWYVLAERYEKRLDREIEETRSFYKEFYKREAEEREPTKVVYEIKRTEPTMPETEKVNYGEKFSSPEEVEVEIELDDFEEEELDYGGPYPGAVEHASLIDFEEFINDDSGWPKVPIFYNPETKKLIDEDDVPIDGWDFEIVGGKAANILYNAKPGVSTGLPDNTFYVINRRRECLYEVMVLDV